MNMQSHPTRVRGLKLIRPGLLFYKARSHPTRVRGLKQDALENESRAR